MGKEITNERLFEFMTKIYGEMREGFKEIREEIKGTKDRVIIIEQEHGKKLDALFDGYKQNSEKLDRIEKEVSRHEEIILRRIK